jgi:hypothetical protein
MLQFSLRRLLLGVTVVAMVAALARIAPAAVGRALLSVLLSLACFAVAIQLARIFRHSNSSLGVLSLGLIAIPAFGFGVMFAIGCVTAFGRAIATLFGG